MGRLCGTFKPAGRRLSAVKLRDSG